MTLAVLVTLLACTTAAFAGRHWPTTRAAVHFRFPPGWLHDAFCIHQHESVDWHRRWVDWAGHPSSYAGGMQFTEQTWESAGGSGEPWQWSPREQLYRAYVRWHADGGRWAVEWGTAGACGLR